MPLLRTKQAITWPQIRVKILQLLHKEEHWNLLLILAHRLKYNCTDYLTACRYSPISRPGMFKQVS